MDYETGIIKGKKTTYSRADGNKVVKYSKTINLGVNSAFDCGVNVVVMAETDYNKLLNSNSIKSVETIEQLNNTIKDNETVINNLTGEVAELNNEIKDMADSNSKNLKTINKITADSKTIELELTEIKRVMKQHNINTADELQQLFKLFELLEIDYIRAIDYLNKVVEVQQQRGLMQRVFNKNVADDIDKPALNYIDVQGNKLNDKTSTLISNKVDDSKE